MSLSELCTQCGLCCDGSLFQHVTLQVEPPEPLKAKVELKTVRDRRIMSLPCGALENRCCSEYASRPENCQRFVCDLGLKVRDEGLAVSDAARVVAEARRLVDQVRELLPPPVGRGVMVHAQMMLVDPSERVPSEVWQRIRQADRYLKEHFLP